MPVMTNVLRLLRTQLKDYNITKYRWLADHPAVRPLGYKYDVAENGQTVILFAMTNGIDNIKIKLISSQFITYQFIFVISNY